MASNRGFIWLDKAGSGSTTTVSGSSITLNNPSTIAFTGGSTFITNNSITTNTLDVDQITNSGQAVLFPNGTRGPDIWYNNAYEFTAGHGNVHWNDVIARYGISIDGTLRVDNVQPNLGNVLNIGQDVSIGGNLTVLGSTTTIASVNSTFADRYTLLNSIYTGTAPLSSGIISINSTIGTIFSLSGNFTATTVGTVVADGLAPGTLIVITNSTANNDVFEVLTHTANLLTIRSAPVFPHSLSSFAPGVVGASVTARRYIASGLEFSSAGNPVAIIDTVKRNIAFDTSSPSFTTLAIASLTPEPAAVTILGRSEFSNEIISIPRSQLGSSINPVFDVRTCNVLNTANTVLGTVVASSIILTALKTVTLELSSFSVNLAVASNTIRIRAGPNVCRRAISFPILLTIAAQIEECYGIHQWNSSNDNLSDLVIVRKNSTAFPIGTVSHATSTLGLSNVPVLTTHTYAINFTV